ncbi:T9SS type B sorting domain-containing protein [Psychroserpens ponticola]|uniref:Choice-of-anchor L domain-containing protein n=1 Tax=Psychroserpens ponticola TaxID=2932268 RepID=A0ABY7RTQ8_9FLAO|nr:choice-of-anchor L domain-containing protein [Psychroserpens ponticola]WCO00348.1 choice-of-anchor L domain-containing protein [Psychroserpens ponticola]
MKRLILLTCLLVSLTILGQNIQVDSQTFTPQQLIEDILIDSDCIENVIVTNVVGGNFNNTDQSYGYFDATGTTFPFQSGVVLSTGRLSNVPGPNATLSDDNAPDWNGDTDLENSLNESNTINATILEFDFTSIASQVSFRYLFASEEYQEGNSNTCHYSDLFGFLIRPIGEQQYSNIALVPNTQTPVKVTTVHSGIPNSCDAINEFYFESWNGNNVPINFNGQTKVLTATADVIPNQTYHVKLVIADDHNYRYDSAVFFEAGSFQLSTNLGPNRLLSTQNALCGNETLELDASQINSNSFKWFKDGVELITETNATYTVTEAGTYNVEITLDNTCVSYGDIVIEYANNPIVFDSVLIECDQDQDGITLYNLYDAEGDITNNDNSIFLVNFYLSENDALQNTNAIINPTNFENSIPFQTVYARVQNFYGCFEIAELELQISNNILNIPTLEACDGDDIDGFATFDLNQIIDNIQNQIPVGANVTFYETENDAFQETNTLGAIYQNITPDNQTIFVKVTNNNQCFSITSAELNVLYTPVLLDDEQFIYCLNSFPETITLLGGVLNDSPSNYYYEWLLNGTTTSVNTSFNEINEPGIYTVIVTDPNGCSSSRTLTVNPSNIATIENIIIQEGTSNNTIAIEVTGEGVYEYALDIFGVIFQENNVFYNVPPGIHTVYVRDLNGCGFIEQTVSVLGFPKFFTPNGDNVHERWHIYGISEDFNQGIDVKIFNRYGKLITQLNHLSPGWDGTLNGQTLPSSDYWFIATLINGKTFTGHFTLKR